MICPCCGQYFTCFGLSPEDNDRLEEKWFEEHKQRVLEHRYVWNLAFPDDPVELNPFEKYIS